MKKTPLKRNKPISKSKPAATPKKVKPKSGVKRKAKGPIPPSVAVLDRLFSDYIRRFGECQLWKYGGIQCSTQLQCSHIHSRSYHSVRWDVGNANCVCAAHHRWQHNNPTLNTWALEEVWGKEHLEALRDRFLQGRKPTAEEKIEIARWLREELRRAA
jgi:hypothetical protein